MRVTHKNVEEVEVDVAQGSLQELDCQCNQRLQEKYSKSFSEVSDGTTHMEGCAALIRVGELATASIPYVPTPNRPQVVILFV